MGLMFATRSPTQDETQLIRALFSTFRDGSGNQRERDGSTRASWREIERCISEAVKALGGEDKQIYDVIAPDEVNPSVVYGLSIKSKQLARNTFLALPSTGRVYMEIANSPAKFWAEIGGVHGHTEREFNQRQHANEIGETVLALVRRWHVQGKTQYEARNPGKTLDLHQSRYVCVSYSADDDPSARLYQIHSFSLEYPRGINWVYQSDRCLRGYDPAFPNEPLIDWYGTSGGQLKYYPRATSAVHQSPVFQLMRPPQNLTLADKARLLFPTEF